MPRLEAVLAFLPSGFCTPLFFCPGAFSAAFFRHTPLPNHLPSEPLESAHASLA
jgi:hypothetical protein